MTEPQRHKSRPRTRRQFNTASLAIALERKFPQEKNAYSILYEVSDSTGFQGGGYCDALVMSTWPSRGLHSVRLRVQGVAFRLAEGSRGPREVRAVLSLLRLLVACCH
jgi:hypothetical protein